jgi:hypothetical protein
MNYGMPARVDAWYRDCPIFALGTKIENGVFAQIPRFGDWDLAELDVSAWPHRNHGPSGLSRGNFTCRNLLCEVRQKPLKMRGLIRNRCRCGEEKSSPDNFAQKPKKFKALG